MMDDDALPHLNSLHEVLAVAIDTGNAYGSVAVNGVHTAWAPELMGTGEIVDHAAEIPVLAEVRALPFLGFLIHRHLVEKIGLPDAGLFIAADDLEYCLRARRAGAKIFMCGRSKIEHPRPDRTKLRILGHEFVIVSLPAWKRYYDIRNRILIAREYFGASLYYKTVPGILVRFFATLLTETNKAKQLRAYAGGLIDGFAGRKGKRDADWRLR
ncbi:MAG: hypothetical protein EON54_09525 [Alcaligenaceae bacterium]|nr:MAG: hypothetical protein EON54_09525 [Alcaligenaceae bacterium]